MIVSELTNNISILQDAAAHLSKITFKKPLQLFIRRLFSSGQLILPQLKLTHENKPIRLGRKVQFPSDHIAMSYLIQKQFSNFFPH